MKLRFVLLLALLFLSTTAFSIPTMAATPDPQMLNKLAEANNHFGFRLNFWLTQQNTKNENVFVSAASIAWAFDMLANGADGATYTAIGEALQLTAWTPEQINQANAALVDSLQKADPQVEIAVANSLWGKPGINFLAPFIGAVQQFYGGKLGPLEKADVINAWVSEKTHGKITSILEQSDITPDSILFLINALYFKGKWEKPFKPELTAPLPFHVLGGPAIQHPMMNQNGTYPYFEDNLVQAVRLPYGTSRLALIVMLPAANSSLKEFSKNLDSHRWQAILSGLANRPGKITLPKFKIEYAAELSDAMIALGMQVAFSNQADFKKLATLPPGWWIKISQVKHKTFIEVNEEGTEAAAVTSIGMRAGSAPPPPQAPFTMLVDRPFYIAIQDSQTGLILFMGSIYNPKS